MFLKFVVGVVAYVGLRSLYNLFFHPLRKIPGPRLAAATYLPEFYHDAIRHGMYLWEIEKMHQRYGPVVRINPREIHICDPEFYNEVYAHSSRRRDKDPRAVAIFGQSYSMSATVSHEHHRLRRGFLGSLFSKRSVLELAPVFQEKVELLMMRLASSHRTASVVCLNDAFSALTADTISYYCYGISFDFLKHPDFKNDIRKALAEFSLLLHVSKFIAIPGFLQMLPQRLMRRFKPQLAGLFDVQDAILQCSAASNHSITQREMKQNGIRKTIFDVLTDAKIPEKERAPHRVSAEGISMLLAGTETTSRSLCLALYHLSNNKEMRSNLRRELEPLGITPGRPVPFAELERCPYLTAVVHEAIRFTCPLTRLPRVAPTEALQCHGHSIPPKTPVSISSYYMNMNPIVFPQPEEFKPERWIEAAEKGINLDQYIASFTKGSRMCIGVNLAYMELYFAIAFMATGLDLEICDTSPKDIEMVRDLGLGFPRDGDFKVQARVTAVIFERCVDQWLH